MATSIPTGPVDPTTDHGDGPSTGHNPGGDSAMQPGHGPSVDADENAVDSLPGAYGEDQAVAGAQHMPNAAQPGATGVAGGGGDGSVGLIGEILNG